MSTAFEYFKRRLFGSQLKQNILKIPSGEIVNGPYLLEHARYNRENSPFNGYGCTLADIEYALICLAFLVFK